MTPLIFPAEAKDAELRASGAPAMTKTETGGAFPAWQPIETAPKDSTPVIVAVPTQDNSDFIVGEAYFDPENYDDGDWWWAGTSVGDYYDNPISETNYHGPSYWMPLPLPPAPGKGGDSDVG